MRNRDTRKSKNDKSPYVEEQEVHISQAAIDRFFEFLTDVVNKLTESILLKIVITVTLVISIGGGAVRQIIDTPVLDAPTEVEAVEVSGCIVSDETGVPASSTSATIVVEPNQFHVWSAGPVTVMYQGSEVYSVRGIAGEGNVILLLPVNGQATEYTMANVNIGSNWHGIWTNCATESTVNQQLENTSFNMLQPNSGNCSVDGCNVVNSVRIEGYEVNVSVSQR